MGHVYYHHPCSKQFSLDFVNSDADKLVSKLVRYDDDVAIKLLEYDLDEPFYAIYTSHTDGRPVKEIEFNLKESLSEVGVDNSTIIIRLFEMYSSILKQNKKEKGEPVKAYKGINVDALPDVLDRTSWEGSATDVAGQLASNLILKHALPNANHRTAVALIQSYLRRLNPDFAMPKTSVKVDSNTYNWKEWVDEYIDESKRLLTVRRNNVVFKHLYDFGARTVERKHSIKIDLTKHELDMYPSEAKTVYGEKHENLWMDFVEEAVERAGYPKLKATPGIPKEEFAESIRDLD